MQPIATHTDVGYVHVDEDGTVLSWDEGAVRLLGYDADDVVGRPFELLAPPEYRSFHAVEFNAAVAAPGAVIVDREMYVLARHADGHDVAVSLTLTMDRHPTLLWTAVVRLLDDDA